MERRGPKQILFGSAVALGHREVSTRLDHESVQALEAAQNPRLTAKKMTATQKRDPKQTHPSEGAMKFCATCLGRYNLKMRAQASARGLPTLLELICKQSRLKQPVLSAISSN